MAGIETGVSALSSSLEAKFRARHIFCNPQPPSSRPWGLRVDIHEEGCDALESGAEA